MNHKTDYMKQWTALFLWVLIFTTACNNAAKEPVAGGGGNMAGGGCTYRHDTATAQVVKINKIDADRFDVLFVLHGGSYPLGNTDTLHYAKEKKELLSTAALKTWHVAIGSRYPYIVSTIISGACNPQTTRLVMEQMQ
jgi:hypothetical protein